MPSRPSPEVREPTGDGLGLYVHVPFCVRRCGYCDFPTWAGRDGEIGAYRRALAAESRRRVRPDLELETVFVGGGTPSHLGAEELAGLIREVLAPWRLAPGAEVTCEANPESVDDPLVEALLAVGVNRVSLGVQSLEDGELAQSGRAHDRGRALAAFHALREGGLERLSVDLIDGLPGQTLASWERSVSEVLALDPGHLSLYSLTLEPGSSWGRESPVAPGWTPDEDLQADMTLAAMELCRAAGYRAYEISSYARPGRECRHNLRYWRSQPVLGLGVGAWSFLEGVRSRNHDQLEGYLEDQRERRAPTTVEVVRGASLARERLVMGLRLDEGVDPDRLLDGPDRERSREVLERYVELGLVERRDTLFRLTDRGRMLANIVMAELL